MQKQTKNQPKRLAAAFAIAEERYLQLGNTRSFPKLQQVLLSETGISPGINTIRTWARRFSWHEHAMQHDLKSICDMALPPELSATPEAIEKRRLEVFHQKEELLELAKGFVQIVKQWQAAPKGNEHIGGARDAQILITATIDCIKESEVLSGRVSDRVAEEKKVTVEEVKAKAKEKSAPLLARLAAVRQMQKDRAARDLAH